MMVRSWFKPTEWQRALVAVAATAYCGLGITAEPVQAQPWNGRWDESSWIPPWSPPAPTVLGFEIEPTGPNGYIYRPVDPAADGPFVANHDEVWQAAQDAFRARRFVEAIRLCDEALASDPDQVLARELLGHALAASGDLVAAADQLRQFLRETDSAEWGAAVRDHAVVFGSHLRFASRLAALEQRVRRYPADRDARWVLAYYYGFAGFTDEALKLLERLRRDSPPDQATELLCAHFEELAEGGENLRAAETGHRPFDAQQKPNRRVGPDRDAAGRPRAGPWPNPREF